MLRYRFAWKSLHHQIQNDYYIFENVTFKLVLIANLSLSTEERLCLFHLLQRPNVRQGLKEIKMLHSPRLPNRFDLMHAASTVRNLSMPSTFPFILNPTHKLCS